MYQGGSKLLMVISPHYKNHDLDVLADYVHDWIDYLHKPDDSAADYTGPRCPFAKKVRDENKIELVKVYDFFSAYDYWEVVTRECDKFDGSKDVVIVAAKTNVSIINTDQMSGAVDGINTFLNCQGRDLWLLLKQDELFTIVMIQKISALDDTSKQLADKGYYTTRYSEAQMEKVVNGRRKYRERLNETT